MKRSTLFLVLLSLCPLNLGFVFAQPLLSSYQNAAEALRASVAAFPDDQVESLDALRRAKTAFGPLGAVLEPNLRRGLNATFSRAEEAIVNQSETDLQVQAAVLQGGFGRAVYQQALESAAADELTNAQNLLGVLGQDLGLADAQFQGSSRAALQGAFEARLAARSLEQLGTFGGDLGNRYRTLAQLYSYIFLVQDSPRLPLKTRDTVFGTIQALVAERPTDAGIRLLQTQLTGFSRRAERAEKDAQAQTGGEQTSAPVSAVSTPVNDLANTPVNAPAAPPVDATTDTTDTTTGTTATSDVASTAANPETNPAGAPFVPPVEPIPDAAVTGNVQPALPSTASVPDQPGTAAAPPFLSEDVRALLFVATGLLALLGLLRLLFAPGLSPWKDAALALLLLPAVAEGLTALAGFLAPLVGQPLLAQVGTYSLFKDPVTQLVWVSLSAAAALCLAVGGRTAERPAVRDDEPDAATQAEGGAAAYTPRSAPLAASTLNWDEDF